MKRKIETYGITAYVLGSEFTKHERYQETLRKIKEKSGLISKRIERLAKEIALEAAIEL